MEIALICALNSRRVIGSNGHLPWHHRADLRFFERTTRDHPVIMGRATYESLPRRPLPRRTHIVLSRRSTLDLAPAAVHCRSLAEALQWCRDRECPRVFVAGGEQVYVAALPLADTLLLTWVPDQVRGDAFFPAFKAETWKIVDSREKNGLRFVTYRRA